MAKIILFISAFVPMYILFLVNLVVEIINGNLHFNITNTVVLISLIVLTIIGVVGLLIIINSKDNKVEKITVLSKQNLTDQHFLNYFSLFVLLALTFDLSKICFICVFIIILLFIGIVYVKNNIFYVNPLLNIMGYSFYDISYKTKDGEIKELRIFYKGEIELNTKQYKLTFSKRNLNFLEKIEKSK
ncbi:MAG: hypothetical protein ACI4PF_05125 [Christensenellales bacterium]